MTHGRRVEVTADWYQIMCAGKDALSRVEAVSIVRRYMYQDIDAVRVAMMQVEDTVHFPLLQAALPPGTPCKVVISAGGNFTCESP